MKLKILVRGAGFSQPSTALVTEKAHLGSSRCSR